MVKGRQLAASVIAGAALSAGLISPMAHAAEGGPKSENPGIVGLTDSEGNQLCSAVLVDSQWALTYDGPLTCANAKFGTGDSHDAVEIDRTEVTDRAPDESQAMLVHFAEPIQRVKPAELDTKAPEEGEKLEVAAFNGTEGINKLLSVGVSPITIEGHNAWLSWFQQPEGMKLETAKDSGAAVLRDGKVVGFVELVTEQSTSAEDIANVADWVKETIGK